MPKVDHLPDRPAQRDSDKTAKNSHGARFGEEEFLHVAVAGANGFHDSDFAAALQNRHDQRVHNSDGSHGQGEAAEDSEEHIEHR